MPSVEKKNILKTLKTFHLFIEKMKVPKKEEFAQSPN